MNSNTYTVINKFQCCGNMMVTVIITNKAVCVMPESEYNKIITEERKYSQKNILRHSA